LPIWAVAWLVKKQTIAIQVFVNTAFYALYTYIWFNPVQDAIAFVYNNFQEWTRPVNDRQMANLDRGGEAAFLNYQLLKHAFRLSWFYLAAFFYNYRKQEKERMKLAISNKELQLRLLKWHLNPSFYFKTNNYLQRLARVNPAGTTAPILQLAKVMEYVIYETKEKTIDVKKELDFISNYIHLLNQQNGAAGIFTLRTEGVYNHLKIAPLMLAGIIEYMAAADKNSSNSLFDFNLRFAGKNLFFSATNTRKLLPGYSHELTQKLNEFYPGKYSLDVADGNKMKLKIELDEA
jgi:hypothetical protein